MADNWNKKEREKKKQQQKQQKEEKKRERREASKDGAEMFAWVDENGNLVSTPPDPNRKVEVNAEDIVIGVPKQREPEPGELIRKGVITYYNSSKQFGFIRDHQTRESIFVHANQAMDPLEENREVSFETEKSPRGLQAVNVRVI